MGLTQQIVAYLGPWSWWVLALVLAGIEVLAPGTFFIWFAIAAGLTGALALLVTLGWQAQVVIFVVLAVVAALVGRRYYGRAGTEADGLANDRAGRQIGRSAVLDTAISHGTGHIRLDDTVWRVEGPDLPAGARVRITGYRDGRFQVVAEG
ncbi:NfeD family protein [Oryzibacter oryziterrae]|uniref:NfeD family protein n=1 Tax=Oryzibacter oryziterrae TaxID=2766474 RepID=UPI001F3E0D3D|nr:NfeD family protein [Oryzibacter oryziterrae]